MSFLSFMSLEMASRISFPITFPVIEVDHPVFPLDLFLAFENKDQVDSYLNSWCIFPLLETWKLQIKWNKARNNKKNKILWKPWFSVTRNFLVCIFAVGMEKISFFLTFSWTVLCISSGFFWFYFSWFTCMCQLTTVVQTVLVLALLFLSV